MKRTAIVYHKDVKNYDFGSGHPFRGSRFPRFIGLLKSYGLLDKPEVQKVEPKTADDSDLLLVHSTDYIDLVDRRAATRSYLSPDTPITTSLVQSARLIVGASLKASHLVADGKVEVAEGVGGGLHHAGVDYGGGFCVYNDVAVCAKELIERRGLERVLIFDSDAHAGNGTMDIFYQEPRVLFISVHQDPYTIYPGTGFLDQIGSGSGKGYTVNIPLPPGADDSCMKVVLEGIFKSLTREFQPQIIIRNGGSDPHFQDGLANLGLTFKGLRSIGDAVAQAASQAGCGVVDLCCSGYNPKTVAEGWLSILAGTTEADVEIAENQPTPETRPKLVKKTELLVENVTKLLSEYWKLE